MKITVDTEKKSIIADESVNINEIMEFIKIAFPDCYKEYTIENSCIVVNVDRGIRYDPVFPYMGITNKPIMQEIIY